jgi:hypothetical protein
MYDNYLTCKKTYLALEDLFLNEFRSFVSKNAKPENFQAPFYTTKFKNGQSFADANPIFSARDTEKNRVMRIVINEEDEEISIHYKSTDFGDETIIFGRIINLDQMLQTMKEWAIRPTL